MLSEYAASPSTNWKAKDCAIYLVIALTVKGKTGKWGWEVDGGEGGGGEGCYGGRGSDLWGVGVVRVCVFCEGVGGSSAACPLNPLLETLPLFLSFLLIPSPPLFPLNFKPCCPEPFPLPPSSPACSQPGRHQDQRAGQHPGLFQGTGERLGVGRAGAPPFSSPPPHDICTPRSLCH